jgi:hypothetical protein
MLFQLKGALKGGPLAGVNLFLISHVSITNRLNILFYDVTILWALLIHNP